MTKALHILLQRQIKRHFGEQGNTPKDWENFIEDVNQAYVQFDEDRGMLERSLEISSQELLQTNSEMRAVFQAFPDLFFRLDSQGTILDYKTADASELYLLPEQMKGRRIQDIPHKIVGQKFQDAVDHVQKTKSRVNMEYSLSVQNQKYSYEARLLPLLEEQMIVIVRNITALKKAEEELKKHTQKLEQSNRDLKDFAYVASHDLQEPLRKIQTFGERLRNKCAAALGEAGSDYLYRMQNAAERMQILITDLLTYSQVTTKSRPFLPVNLNEIVKNVLSDLEIRIENVSGKVIVERLPTIESDTLQMRQLFQNLIGNALKFHRKDAPPVIKVYSSLPSTASQDDASEGSPGDNELCQVIVEDNGIGFEDQYADRIFSVFQRLHGRNEYEGTGVGLSICRKIAERHGGTIVTQSAVGKGSKFIVTLPVKQKGEQ